MTLHAANSSVSPERTYLVIGAGIAGLTAARAVQNAGYRVQVLDKGRGVGGRMATRRFGDGVFDHGAQFVTARNARFRESMQRWQETGIAKLWADGFPSAHDVTTAPGHPRYRGHPGMTAIPKALAAGLDIQLTTRIQAVRVQDERWQAISENGILFAGDALLLTPPVPQSLALLDAGNVALPSQMDASLRRIAYHPCIALLAILDKPTRIPSPGGMQFAQGSMRWMADNQQKGISPHAVAVTIHATPDFSTQHWDADEEAVADKLLAEAAPWLPGTVQAYQVHRWRYSQPVDLRPITDIFLPGPSPLAFAGDAFAGGRVEGAAVSGWEAAQKLVTA